MQTYSQLQTAWTEILHPQRSISLTHRDRSRKVACFARQLMRHEKGLSLSDAMRYAWNEIRNDESLTLIRFISGSGKDCQRIVYTDWKAHYTPTGTGHATKPGQILFADAARIHTGMKSVIISAYENLILEQF